MKLIICSYFQCALYIVKQVDQTEIDNYHFFAKSKSHIFHLLISKIQVSYFSSVDFNIFMDTLINDNRMVSLSVCAGFHGKTTHITTQKSKVSFRVMEFTNDDLKNIFAFKLTNTQRRLIQMLK